MSQVWQQLFWKIRGPFGDDLLVDVACPECGVRRRVRVEKSTVDRFHLTPCQDCVATFAWMGRVLDSGELLVTTFRVALADTETQRLANS